MKTENHIIATHSGAFHADDVFAVAVLLTLYPNAEVVRTRDPAIIASAYFAVDVGGEWDPWHGRFDHHQAGFPGRRPSGVGYASAGLVWKEHGNQAVQHFCPDLDEATAADVQAAVDEALVQHIDMADTGAAQGAPGYFGLTAMVDAYNTTRGEENTSRSKTDDAAKDESLSADESARMKLVHFRAAVSLVQGVLERVVKHCAEETTAADVVRSGERVFDGRVLVLPEAGLPWARVVCQEMPQVLFVVYQEPTDREYRVHTVPVAPASFEARKSLPAPWAGLRGDNLAQVCRVFDAVFCHNGLFIAGAVSKGGALRMAELALAAK